MQAKARVSRELATWNVADVFSIGARLALVLTLWQIFRNYVT
jgi:hypothetical protein